MRKISTGIPGFDAVTGGGLPANRTTLVAGGTGSGKTVFALQSLVHGARVENEPGIFVCFEERSGRITANAAGFDWSFDDLSSDRLCFVDAQPDPDLVHTGRMDIAGLLAGLEATASAMGARRIVLDAIDVVLALVDDPATIRREIYRLQNWLVENEMTALVTSKVIESRASDAALPSMEYLPFMVDCLLRLDHVVVDGMSQRSLRVCKYRGSAFEENALPMTIGAAGIEVASYSSRSEPAVEAGHGRLSSGLADLDDMLGGGYFRGSSILVTGSPGTAKTTLCGAFAQSACARGERALFVSFDSRADEIVRNLASVDIRLSGFLESGRLRIVSMRALSGNAEITMARIREEALRLDATCLVADPLSALAKSGNRSAAPGVAERLIDWAKGEGMTTVCTCLPDGDEGHSGTPLQVSTIADTWIHLTYVINAGERNRGLSIIKARGTGHSNQVRELVLSRQGARLAEVYTAGGEVLMGSMRFEHERAQQLAAEERSAQAKRDTERLNAEAAELEAQIGALQRRLAEKREEQESLVSRISEREDQNALTRQRLYERRRGSQADGRDGGDDER